MGSRMGTDAQPSCQEPILSRRWHMGQVLEAGPDRRQGGRAHPVSSFLACFPPPILSPSPRTLGLVSASVLSLHTSPRGAPAPTSRGSEQSTWMVHMRHSSSNSTLPPPSLRFTEDATEAPGAAGGGGAVRDFRVTGFQHQSRAKSRISDAKAPLPALVSPQHAPPGPQHGFSIRNHSRQEPSKGEPPPEPSALDNDARGLLVLVSLRPSHTAVPVLCCITSGFWKSSPRAWRSPDGGLRSADGSQPGKPSGRQERLSGSSALWEGVPPTAPAQPTGAGHLGRALTN